MNTWNLFLLMVVLFAMMLTGYIAYKLDWIDDNSHSKLSGMVVHIFNPMLIISGVVGKDLSQTGDLITQNLFLVILMFAYAIPVSVLVVAILRIPKEKRGVYRFMLIFSNLGFMGIPLITALYGSEKVIFVSFYVLIFNILFYTLGIYILSSSSGRKGGFSLRKILNTGTIACLIAIVIFYAQITVPDPAVTFISYMGNAAVPLSMMVIGASLAKSDLKTLFSQPRYYFFVAFKTLILPIIIILILKNFNFDNTLLGIFLLMVSMPIASMSPMLIDQYGSREHSLEAAQMVTLSTVAALVTLPLVSLIL